MNSTDFSRKEIPMRDEFFTDEIAETPSTAPLAIPRGLVKKVGYGDVARSIVAAFLEDNSALEAYVRLRNIADVIEEALGQIKENAIAQVEGNSQIIHGAMVQVKALPKKWEYHDSQLGTLEAEKLSVDLRIKARKKYLEALKEEFVDPATGETSFPARCIAQGVTIQITF
jgi:hypothetical protein